METLNRQDITMNIISLNITIIITMIITLIITLNLENYLESYITLNLEHYLEQARHYHAALFIGTDELPCLSGKRFYLKITIRVIEIGK